MYREADLNGYLPVVMSEVCQLNKLNNAINGDINRCWEESESATEAINVLICDEKYLERFEKMFGCDVSNESERARRISILNILLGELPYTLKSIERKIEVLCGEGNFEIEFAAESYTLNVRLGLLVKKNINEVYNLLLKRIPANIILNVSILYNNHEELARFTHGYLEDFTHAYLKEEKFI